MYHSVSLTFDSTGMKHRGIIKLQASAGDALAFGGHQRGLAENGKADAQSLISLAAQRSDRTNLAFSSA